MCEENALEEDITFLYNVHISTLYTNISAQRIARLAGAGHPLFHIDDLSMLLEIADANTLRVTLYRLVRAGILHRIHRGLYSLLPPTQIDPVLLCAAALHRSCTLTTESVLRDEGYILQSMNAFTFVSGVSRRSTVAGHRLISRQLHPRFLHNQAGIVHTGGIARATPERAIADMLFFDPWYHFDRPIDWEKILALQQAIGYPLTPKRYADSSSR